MGEFPAAEIGVHRSPECLQVKTPLSRDDARRIVAEDVAHYNAVRLHSAIGYVTPKNRLEGHQGEIFAASKRKFSEARARRRGSAPR